MATTLAPTTADPLRRALGGHGDRTPAEVTPSPPRGAPPTPAPKGPSREGARRGQFEPHTVRSYEVQKVGNSATLRLISQVALAEAAGVGAPTVTKWKGRGTVVLEGKLVDVDATLAALRERHRGGGELADRIERKLAGKVSGNSGGNIAAPAPTSVSELDEANEELQARYLSEGDAFVKDVLSGAYRPLDEATKIKANALALKHVLAAKREAGKTYDRDEVDRIFFEAGRAVRDAWRNFPSRIGPLLAASLKVDTDRLTYELTEYVHQQLADMGEPEMSYEEPD